MHGAICPTFSNDLQISETLDDPPEQDQEVATRSDKSHESESDLQDKEEAGAWSFCALIKGAEWDPSIFTRVLDVCASGAFRHTLAIAKVLS